MSSECKDSEVSGKKDKEIISNNISAILSNGIHCSYLLNTMTNPSTLPYSNYAFGDFGYAQQQNMKNSNTSPNHQTQNHTANAAHNTANTAVAGHTAQMNNSNINPMYIYQYPQTQQHTHYDLFQMTQRQNHNQYTLNPYAKYNQSPLNMQSMPPPYIINPYDPCTTPQTTTFTSHSSPPSIVKYTQTQTTHTPHKITNANTNTNNVSQKRSATTDYYSNATVPMPFEARHSEENILKQIVSIPDEFASAINDDFSEMIGMQDLSTTQQSIPKTNTITCTKPKDQIIITNNDINNIVKEESHCDESNCKWENEEFISKRKQQIIRFLKLWDTAYPTTSENGENIQNQNNNDSNRSSSSYNFPPGLTQIKSITNDENEGHSHNEEELIVAESEPNYLKSPSYVFRGSFEEAKILGTQQNKWVMLNIQDTDWFTAQWSNPLIWKHKRYGLIIKENFIFFNVVKFAEKSIGFINLYNIENIPSVSIIDPYSNVKRYEFSAPSTSTNIVKLRKDMLNLLNSFPSPTAYNNAMHSMKHTPTKPTKPPIPHKFMQAQTGQISNGSSPNVSAYSLNNLSHTSSNTSSNSNEECVTIQSAPPIKIIPSIQTRKRQKNKSGFRFTSQLEISSESHIYCSMNDGGSKNIWDLCYPCKNLKSNAYVLSTRQTFDWNDWMLIISKCSKIIGAIPSEQHIEFLRNRNGEMTLESSGTYNGWWSEKRIAEFVVNEKFGLSYEGGFASENGRERIKFLKSLELPRRPTFKKMLVIIPNMDNNDKILFHDNSVSITSYSEYDKMDNITSFQLWLTFITYLSVNMFETSLMYQNNRFNFNECTNFCIKLGSKWKLPLSTLYNDIEPLINNKQCKNILFSYPKIATDATTHHCLTRSSIPHHSLIAGNVLINKYHHNHHNHHNHHSHRNNIKTLPGFEICFLSKSDNHNMNGKNYKYDSKRALYVKSYEELENALRSTEQFEVLDFPFPLFSSGWFSFNTLSIFATILEQHLHGTWVSMFSLNSGKQFKQIFDMNKNTRRRSILYTKLLQQKLDEQNYKKHYLHLSHQLSTKNKQRLISFWNENRLYWTDLIIDKSNKQKNIGHGHGHSHDSHSSNDGVYDENKKLHKNHNNRNYRKKQKKKFRNRNRTKRKQNKINV